MSLLPQQMLPQTQPLGVVSGDKVIIDKNWWLLLYNFYINTFGAQGLTGDNAFGFEQNDIDTLQTSVDGFNSAIQNLQVLPDYVPSPDDLPDIARALLLAQDGLLPDPVPAAQPFVSVSPTGTPFAYTVDYSGAVCVEGGTVTAITLTRQGTSINTGVIAGVIPVSRGDILTVAYSADPTITFIPGGQ